ncbi:MAG: 6-phosphofructokinase, partial [Verrucomicrobiae bacterium]|nr:6-phosphofructokinase [Verrucomicrobiae bacterium]
FNGVQAFEDWENSQCVLVCDSKQYPERGRRLETPQHAHEGGSILGTSRDDDLLDSSRREEKLKRILHKLDDFSILYVIGGDGGMRLAHALRNFAREEKIDLSVVGIPKTMDNDILWVWQSFGFLSAVEKAREVIEHVHTEIASNPRLGIVQLFGSVSGFVVSHAVLAGSTPRCYLALVPEVEFKLREVAEYLAEKLAPGSIPGGLVVMAESALPTDALEIIEELDAAERKESDQADPKQAAERLLTRREREAVQAYLELRKERKTMSGQTSDHLRSACLKIVGRGLEFLLKQRSQKKGDRWDKLRVLTNEPRHIIRAIPPSCLDIITGRRLGGLAVDNAMAGYTDFMISQWLTEFVLVPLRLVVLGRKQIHQEGIFWKSVLAKTGSWRCFGEKNEGGAEPTVKNDRGRPAPKRKTKPRR